MNNYVIQSRVAATATATAFLLVGQGLQDQTAASRNESSPLIRFNFTAGSQPRVVVLTTRQVAERADNFEAAVNGAFQLLASRQHGLEPDLVEALAQSAWDLYEEA
jgi:thiamine biosynthesis lipoprotein ApbE